VVSFLAYSSILKMHVVCFSETSANFDRTTRRYTSEDSHCSENLKCDKSYFWLVLRLRPSCDIMMTGYRLGNQGTGVQFLAGAMFSTDYVLVLGPNQPPIQSVPATLYSRLKRPGHEADNSPPSSAQVENGGALSPLPHKS
jgi:hypothetical protein